MQLLKSFCQLSYERCYIVFNYKQKIGFALGYTSTFALDSNFVMAYNLIMAMCIYCSSKISNEPKRAFKVHQRQFRIVQLTM